jgi:tellurite resistance protein TerC
MDPTVGTPLLWGGFVIFILAMLALDLGVFHKKSHRISFKESAAWTVVWISLAAVFNVGVYHWFGPQKALEFTAGYLLEKALSVDNLFVFLVLFRYFRVPAAQQHRVLLWGIVGALVLRAIFIAIGGAFLSHFTWAIYIFGGLLVVTGIKLLATRESAPHPERNLLVRLAKRIVPVTHEFHDQHFTIIEKGRRVATPLFLTLIAIESSDVIFAIDSIPAVFAVTSDPFIVFTSNIFAIMGLRALYFLLAGVMDRFHHLKIGLALVLLFVGAKMLLSHTIEVPIGVSLAVIAVLIGGSILLSILRPQAETPAEDPPASTSAQPR